MFEKPILIGSDIYHRTGMTSKHPLAWPKTAPTLDLIRSLGWYDEAMYIESPKATPRRLGMFHDPAYIEAAFDIEASQQITNELRNRFGIGSDGNPFFPGVIERASTACGAAIKAANLLVNGGIVHSPLGGAHHSQPAKASGFGYFNDIVLGILTMLDNGLSKIAYIDIDAHHGDAVESAFANNPNVLTLSIHEEECWPYSGTESYPQKGIYNIPVPAGFNDSEMLFLLEKVILPLLEKHKPEAIVIQAGADSIADDLMMKLELSNRAYFKTIDILHRAAPRIWVTGGGGYNPWAVVRCWAGIWCILNGRDPADEPPITIEEDIKNLIQKWHPISEPPENWLATLADDDRIGKIRTEVKKAAKLAM